MNITGNLYSQPDSTAESYAKEYGHIFADINLNEFIYNGALNMNGEFSVTDIVTLQKWLSAVPDTHLANWQAADLCQDGKLDIFDLCLMKRKLIQ